MVMDELRKSKDYPARVKKPLHTGLLIVVTFSGKPVTMVMLLKYL
jgi:hypothetical protein